MMHYYTIFIDGVISGGVDIRELEDGYYRLNRMFLHPNFQGKGLGSNIMELVEQMYP